MTDKPESGDAAALIEWLRAIAEDQGSCRTRGDLHDIADALARLSAPVPDKDHADAKRYRWMRATGAFQTIWPKSDEAIDAAMAAEQSVCTCATIEAGNGNGYCQLHGHRANR